MYLSRVAKLLLTAGLLATGSLPRPASAAPGAGTLSPYTDPRLLTGVPFGSHSHYAQTWRATLETVPAAGFLSAIGTVWTSSDLSRVPALAASGVRRLRVEEPWAQMAWDESGLGNASSLTALLQTAQANGIRTRLLLNANQGVPGPMINGTLTLAAPVKVGASTITVRDASAVVINHTGLSNTNGYTAAYPLFTARQGSVLTLSAPSPLAYAAGQVVAINTLKYLPFTAQGSAEYGATLIGWLRYEMMVARTARAALDTVGKSDGGFDLECWNELTFGSAFLDAANYGLPAGPNMIAGLPQITGAIAAADPADFSGVGLSDGMANTLPWPASSSEPVGITSLSKHPYQGRSTFPRDNYAGTTLNALYRPDPWVPSYTEHFPEYMATAIQTETMTRDLAPITSDLYATAHGRYANTADGPVPVAITEYRYDPDTGGAADQVTKAILRFFCFYPNKGAEEADWYDSEGLLAQPDALAALARICAVMRQGLDASAPARSLSLDSVSDTHGHAQFAGDGTAAHPPLYDRDCFAFLPYQVGASRFVVPYYVMTRDVAQDLPAETFILKLSGLGKKATASSCDPLTGAVTPVATLHRGNETFISVSATDCPRLLLLSDAN